jgi:peptidoglycan/LPS O-acetylase OafA/YrhL
MRFNTLDGLRGFAAVLVLFYHLGGRAPIAAPGGYLAVDLFFGLSGFVIALAYEERLRAGLRLREFAVMRLIRVYPMAFIGAATGVLLADNFLPSLLLLPDFGGQGMLYPANGPLWSLALELAANFVFAIVALRVGGRGLAAIIFSSAIVLAIGVVQHRLAAIGPFWSTIGYGIARTVFSFTLGVCIQRIHAAFAIRRHENRLAWLPPLALIILLTQIPTAHKGWELACVFLFLPVILWCGTIWEAPGNRLFSELGGLSYPLYATHGVIIQAFRDFGEPPIYLWFLLIIAAWWLNSRVDVPLRRRLLSLWKKSGVRADQPQALHTP